LNSIIEIKSSENDGSGNGAGSDNDLTDIPELEKRRRDSSNDSFEIPETKKLNTQVDLNQTILMDSAILNEPVKLPKVMQRRDKLMIDPENIHIFIKYENEDPHFFAKVKTDYKDYQQNAKIEKGCVLKLGELTKEVILNILQRFNTDHSPKENQAELTKKNKILDNGESQILE